MYKGLRPSTERRNDYSQYSTPFPMTDLDPIQVLRAYNMDMVKIHAEETSEQTPEQNSEQTPWYDPMLMRG